MKTISFIPLRVIKKSGKIVVASYMQWRKVKTADHYPFNLIIPKDHNRLNPNDYVHDHKGRPLFWFNYPDPSQIPKNTITIHDFSRILNIPIEHLEGEEWKISEPLGEGFHSSVHGFDVDGVPTFSHWDAERAATFTDITQFQPLTLKIVLLWYGWFLYSLKNSKLIIRENTSAPK